jgi:hypothetical protein
MGMRRLLLILICIIPLGSCKKVEFSPEGPTDVRVENLSDLSWDNVIVDTSGGTDTLGSIASHGTSAYSRFDKAFPKAEITATINGQVYTTGPVVYTYLTYIGQAKITYRVFIKSDANRTLEISDCSLDAPLD